MRLSVYTIYDVIAQTFNKPFTEINHGTATRSFKQSLAGAPNPEDYILYYIGTFDTENGELIAELRKEVYYGNTINPEEDK